MRNEFFWGNMRIDDLEKYKCASGLATDEDLQEIEKHYDLEGRSIIDIGAGYGRAAEFLYKNMINPRCIHAIEKNPKFVNHLKKRGFYDVVYEMDIKHLGKIRKKYDVALCLWNTIHEFSQREQRELLQMMQEMADLAIVASKRFYQEQPKEWTIPVEYEEGKDLELVSKEGTLRVTIPTIEFMLEQARGKIHTHQFIDGKILYFYEQ